MTISPDQMHQLAFTVHGGESLVGGSPRTEPRSQESLRLRATASEPTHPSGCYPPILGSVAGRRTSRGVQIGDHTDQAGDPRST